MKPEDAADIDELLTRSIASILPSRELFKKALLAEKKLRIYIGADATGPDLHIGHATNFIFLEKLRKLGHEIIVLFGDFTAMIGDPTDKDATRVALTEEEVEKNLATWKLQVGKILSLDDKKNPVRIVKNSTWLSKLSFADVVKLASNFTVQQMMERDMFEKRMVENKPIHLHEFLYPLMQGYDSVELDVDAEVGGNDQTFNMLAGRTLQRKMHNKEKFVIATTLLVNPKTGQKLMSKSTGGYISLQDSPNDMFGKAMALPDEAIIAVFIDCTLLSLPEIESIKKDLEGGKNPKDAKIRLGKELVGLYYDATQADKAEKNFTDTFSKKGISDDAEVFSATSGEKIIDVIVRAKLVSSKTEARRLFDEGAVSEIGGEKITDQAFGVTKDINVKVGKHRFLKIKVS
ncbi:MAG: tyrosine--tRNA ligase [Candidatus Pacebacteria bacterium]|nr:tyrosine--tRNA ligase [Candidatus Paceibacterota bacterium]